jgi:DNA-binding NarL/FixJ family response regulator
MADAELAPAERFGAPVPIVGALHARAVAEPDDAATVALCERELAAAGKGNRQIAQALFLSIKTVETHLAAGYRKLGVGTRAELAAQLAR